MHLHSYLRSASEIIRLYDGSVPLASWLKNYFRQHKKFGSKDRRMITDLCYCYCRLGNAFTEVSVEERLLIGQFLCHTTSPFVEMLKPEWSLVSSASTEEKLTFLNAGPVAFFPFREELSKEIEKDLFDTSHLMQPDLFLRIRPGKKKTVLQKLENAGVSVGLEGDCLRMANTTKIDSLIELDKEAVIQDKSSQQVINPLKENWQQLIFTSWDCCAASGGKTILLHDHYPKAQLTVSDIRESILHNLRGRFKRASISPYESFVIDVSSDSFQLKKKFDVILCDAPCSGSGTWGRTPEQLVLFRREKIDHYTKLQKSIAGNAVKCLKDNGFFLYITCSVFRKENEEVVDHLLQNTPLKLVKQQYFKGYHEKADTLFAALFTL